MSSGTLGKEYADGDYIIRQGELGDKMYVIQEGEVEVVLESEQGDLVAATLGKEEIIGEMALFDQEVRSASVRAKGKVHALAVDRKNLFARISENPTLAFRLIRTLCTRVRSLDQELAMVKTQLRSENEE